MGFWHERVREHMTVCVLFERGYLLFALPCQNKAMDIHIERCGEFVEPRERGFSHAAFIERNLVLAYPRLLPEGAAR